MQNLTTIPPAEFIEIDYRENDGIEVSLLLNRPGEQLTIYVSDGRTGEGFEFAVAAEHASDAFAHPFAYADSMTTCSILSGRCSDSNAT